MNNFNKNFDLAEELQRKSFHLLILLLPIIYHFLGKHTSLIIFYLLGSIIIGLDYSRRKFIKIHKFFINNFGKIMRDSEKVPSNMCGISFLFMAAIIIFTIAKKEIAIISFIILAISDSVAAIIGKSFPSDKFFEKTFNGSLAFATSALIIAVIFGIIFDAQLIYYLFALFAVFATAIIESRPSIFKIDDNFTIPCTFAFLMTLFDSMWHIF